MPPTGNLASYTGLQPPSPSGVMAPASWWEFYFAAYPLTHYIPVWRVIGTTVVVGAGSSMPGTISNTLPIFVYAITSSAFVTATAVAPTTKYRLGFKQSSDVDFTQGAWANDAVTGFFFPIPLELTPNVDYTVTIDNSLIPGTPAITVDVLLQGIEPKRRRQALTRENIHNEFPPGGNA